MSSDSAPSRRATLAYTASVCGWRRTAAAYPPISASSWSWSVTAASTAGVGSAAPAAFRCRWRLIRHPLPARVRSCIGYILYHFGSQMKHPSVAVSLWLIVAASTCASLANGALTTLLPLYADDVLHLDALASGVLVGVAPLVGLAAQPLVGRLADRSGYFCTWLGAGVIGVAGILLMLVSGGFGGALASRTLFGILSSAAGTVMAAWVIGIVPAAQRGRALARFGVSVWIGLGAGPQLGQVVIDRTGYAGLWIVAAALVLASIVLARPLPEPELPGVAPHAESGQWIAAARAVLLPGTVAALAWSSEGVILTFGIVHLRDAGLPVGGPTGATTVLTVFAASVIAVRFLLGSVTDRLGPARTAISSLILLAIALVGLALAQDFRVAALSAVVLGLAFAPLYPALTLLADDRLDPRRRATGLGIFGALTGAGVGAGTLYGGALSAWSGTAAAFLATAALQLAGIVLTTRRR
ncbi:MFS transporter [Cryptosporangium sp. NPDC051539]|uniref:MFS transporter n=1 Tax=Cryptosporangium sp. NPDC051539 TaxID=3363962 RepID=UPI0037B427C6